MAGNEEEADMKRKAFINKNLLMKLL